MKKSRALLLLIFTTTFISCTNDKNDHYKLIIEYETKVNDKIKVYYSTIPNADINGQNFIDKYTFAKNGIQKIIVDFPEDIVPFKIRLDICSNQNVSQLSIKNLSVSYGENIINGDDGEFINYWSPNESIQYNKNNFLYDIIVSPASGSKTPVFMSNINLEKEIKTLRPYLFW